MESERQVIPMSLVPQHIYCKSTSATNNWKIYGFFIHASVHHGEWKTSHSNVTCATTHLHGMTCLSLSMMITCVHEKPKYFSSTCCKSWLAVNVLWHKWHWNDLSSTLHDEHLYGWKILHRTFQFPDIINFITTRCQQLFAKHLLLNITLFYALLHSFFKFLPSKLLKNRTKTGLGS